MSYLVYMHTHRATGRKYIGATSKTLKARMAGGRTAYVTCKRLHEVLMLEDWQAFDTTVVAEGLSGEAAAKMERDLIIQHKTTDPQFGFNRQTGGLVDEHKLQEKIRSASNTLKTQRSTKAYRALMVERMQGVWSDPERKEHLLACRRGKLAGRPAVAIKDLDTGIVYPTLVLAAVALGLSKAMISVSFSRAGSNRISIRSKKLGRVLNLERSQCGCKRK